ncbi:MAG: hypothetical protein GXO76_01485 [Calditrichaeota bacterium]|nr:hypothetical protein [Calditrichota bacterium]
MKRTFLIILLVVFGLTFATNSFAEGPKVEWHGLFYIYNFFHKNTDFDKNTPDGNSYMYIHGDIQYNVDFGKGVSIYTMIGAWSQHGINPYWGTDLQGNTDPDVRILQGYLTVSNIFDSPFSFRMGKERLLYGDGTVFFDGGEDGAIQAKLMYNKGPLDVDFFYSRLAQSHGIAYVGAPTYNGYDPTKSDQYPGNINLLTAYGTYHAMGGKMNVSAYGVMRPQNINKTQTSKPIWLGARVEASPISGLDLTGEYTLLRGTNDAATAKNYKGYALVTKADYALAKSPLSFGGAFIEFSGDNTSTKTDNELYESATNGPFTFGFYKDWPGFGPAHLMTTAYGFAGLDPGNLTMTNLNVINAHAKVSLGDLGVRFDFYNYARNWVPSNGHAAMGNEVSVLATYNYKKTITFGFTAGMWMPGDYWKTDMGLGNNADNAFGGYFYFAKEF